MIAKRIKELRTQKNLTQKELAVLISLTPKMISFYELGQRIPPSDIIIKLAKIFAVSTDYLLGETNIKESADKLIAQNHSLRSNTIDQGNLDKLLQQDKITFDGISYKLTDSTREKVRVALKIALYDNKKA